MPADNTLSQSSTARHGDAAKPYPCHQRPKPPGDEGFIDFGYCRTSLDLLVGVGDSRCPANCPHKAPAKVAQQFDKLFGWRGAAAAAKWAKGQRRG